MINPFTRENIMGVWLCYDMRRVLDRLQDIGCIMDNAFDQENIGFLIVYISGRNHHIRRLCTGSWGVAGHGILGSSGALGFPVPILPTDSTFWLSNSDSERLSASGIESLRFTFLATTFGTNWPEASEFCFLCQLAASFNVGVHEGVHFSVRLDRVDEGILKLLHNKCVLIILWQKRFHGIFRYIGTFSWKTILNLFTIENFFIQLHMVDIIGFGPTLFHIPLNLLKELCPKHTNGLGDFLVLQVSLGLNHHALFVLRNKGRVPQQDVGSHVTKGCSLTDQVFKENFMPGQVWLIGFIGFLGIPKIARSNFSYLSSRTVFPHTPPSVVTRSLTPSKLFTFNFSGSKRTTFWKADPLHCNAARGASWLRCSLGQMPARNSRRLAYSARSVSPGLKWGIKCQGSCEPVVFPDGAPGSEVPSIDIVDTNSFQIPLDHLLFRITEQKVLDLRQWSLLISPNAIQLYVHRTILRSQLLRYQCGMSTIGRELPRNDVDVRINQDLKQAIAIRKL